MNKSLQNFMDTVKTINLRSLCTQKNRYSIFSIHTHIKLMKKQDVFAKHNAPDNGQFQLRPRSQGQIF